MQTSLCSQYATKYAPVLGARAAAPKRRVGLACKASPNGVGNPEPMQVQFDWDQLAPGIKQMIAARDAAQYKAQKGDSEGAKQALRDGIQQLDAAWGDRALCVEALHVQSFMLHWIDAEYQQALQSAEAAFNVGLRAHAAEGSDMSLHRMRLGMAQLGCGNAAAALPLLSKASSSISSLLEQARQSLAGKVQEQGYEVTQADLEILITLSLAAAEARFYLALCALALAGEAGDAGPAELEMLEASMAEGVQEMALALREATNPAAVTTALREHARLLESSWCRDDPTARQRVEAQRAQLLQAVEDVKRFLQAEGQR